MDSPFRLSTLYIFSFLCFCVVIAYYINASSVPMPRARSADYLQVVDETESYIRFVSAEANVNQTASRHVNHSVVADLPIIYIITPTHGRLEQKADLTRMVQTLKLVPNVHWIVIEDSETRTVLVSNFLKDSGLPFTHLCASTAKIASRDGTGKLYHRGVEQRNAGLEWLRIDTFPATYPGVVYFADDDNTYDIRLFEEMRPTKKVSVWPVGLSGSLRYESPIVKDNKVVGWLGWKPSRRFALDMAGFAVNLQMVYDHPKAKFSHHIAPGELETRFLSALSVSLNDLEPRADQCTKVLVWHTRTQKTNVGPMSARQNVYVKSDVADKETVIKKYMAVQNFEV